MYSPVDEIKNKLDAVELIGGYLKLTKAGRNYKACCPFHGEKTPSFMVSPERQIWHCFGCGLGGDIFSFVMKIEGVEFGDALRILARRTGVVLKKQDPQAQSQKKRLYEICDLAAKFFSYQLDKSASGQKAAKYLSERGLKKETIKAWRLGWAPDNWRVLGEFLKSRGYQDEEILQAGLAVQKDPSTQFTPSSSRGSGHNSDYYDRFRSRIMFPLFDIQGQTVGFAGRIFGKKDENTGKYINTPQTVLYDKSRLLYGLNFAKMELRSQNSCIFVEGNLDVIMSHQAGVKNAVATSGTALTDEHLKIIKRYTDNLLFAFDSDDAGENATRRGLDLAMAQDFNIKVIMLDSKDPADVIQKDQAEWPQAIKEAKSVMDFYFVSVFNKYSAPLSVENKKQIGKFLLPVIKNLASRVEQMEWVRELAQRLKANEKDILWDLGRIKIQASGHRPADSEEAVANKKTRLAELEKRIIGLLLNYQECLSGDWPISGDDFSDQNMAAIFRGLEKIAKKGTKGDLMGKLKKELPGELANSIGIFISESGKRFTG